MKEKIPVLVGPTASGKTAASIALAHLMDAEIISADSMQIYKHMDVGTAKPTAEEMDGVPHHLIDCVEPDVDYSVACFKADALAAIDGIRRRGRVPLIVGGTGLYINALTLPWIADGPTGSIAVRRKLEQEWEEQGSAALYARLQAVDPASAEAIHPNNVKRVIRALEIYEATGKPKSQWDGEAAQEELPYDYVLMGITMDRERLYQRIDLRVDQMLAEGLMDEMKGLLARGYGPELTAMKAIGYKELMPVLAGEESLEEGVRILKRDTRHFAKRQLTWFRRDERIRWFEAASYADVRAMARAMADHYQGQL